MFKYRVTFKTIIQTDGWTDFRDREYKVVKETITVVSPNMKYAEKAATIYSDGYLDQGPFYTNKHRKWERYHIVKVVRLKKGKVKCKAKSKR